MRVLVTGGSGFLGQFVLRELVARGHHPVALARSTAAAKAVSAAGAEALPGDLDEPDTLDGAFSAAKADALANIASLGFGHAPAIVAAAEEAGIERALFVSTTAIFTTLPAQTKAVRTAAEDTIRASSLAWTIVRPTMIYGAPGDRNMERLLRFLRRAPVVPLPGGGRRLIQPVHVADLAGFVVTALEADTAGQELDVGGPEPLALSTVVTQAAAAVHRRPAIVDVPLQPAIAALRVYERATPRPRLKVEQVLRLDEDKVFDISAARALGFEPRSFERGIGEEAREAFIPVVTVGTYLRTVAHLRPEQIVHRIRLRTLRKLDRWFPPRLPPPPVGYPGWPEGFRSLEADLDHGDASAIAEGRFTFLAEERRLGDPADWDQADAAHLWRFNLHYFEWAWALAAAEDRQTFVRLWRSWFDSTTIGHPDAWAPYVASTRAWVLCDVYPALVRGTEVEAEVVASLSRHLAFIRRRLELDVGGNHLLRDLKALAGLGVFLNERATVEECRDRLAAQIAIQVLSDGGHFERSPSYHCQVLGDLIDISALFEQAGVAPVPGLDDALIRMRRWLGAMVAPNDELPMFNDSFHVGPDRLQRLGPEATTERLIALAPSGYIIARLGGGVQLVADVGDPCPPDLPAHAHADCLSFELWVANRKVIADTGTSTYEPGDRRAFERSTAAHNTVEIDGKDQTEVWGAFRAGRRAHGKLLRAQDSGSLIFIEAHHDGYRNLPGSPLHRRTWRLQAGRLEVLDSIDGYGNHALASWLRLIEHPAQTIELTANGQVAAIRPRQLFDGFGQPTTGQCHSLEIESADLPARIGWTMTWDRPPPFNRSTPVMPSA